MKKGIIYLSFLGLISFSFLATSLFAQGVMDEEATIETEMYFASGVVDLSSADQIVILEYDFDAGQEVKVAYHLDGQTQFVGVSGYADIQPGDDVEIEYQMAGDKNIAIRIEKYTSDMMEDLDSTLDASADRVQAATADRLNAENAAVEMGESPFAGR